MKYLLFFAVLAALLSFFPGCSKGVEETPVPDADADTEAAEAASADDDSATEEVVPAEVGETPEVTPDATPVVEELSDEEKARLAAEALNASGGVPNE